MNAENRARRHSPWFALLAALIMVLGMLVPAANATAAKYPYKAPPELAAVNSTKTGVELYWRTITGAPAYRVRAVGGGQTLYQNTGSDGTTVFQGLQPSTSYTFNVAVLQVADGKLLSPWSSAKATRATTAATMLEPPTALTVTRKAPGNLDLTWVLPVGFDAAVHVIRIDYAEDQAMTIGKGSQDFEGTVGTAKDNPATMSGLGTNTNYYLRASVVSRDARVAVGDRTTSILGKTLSPIGWIHGTVTGAPNAALANYVVAGYSASTGDVNHQVPLTKTGTDGVYEYKLQVRPGNYYVQVVNIGTANYTSRWAQTGTAGALVLSSGTQIGVSVGNVTEAPPVTVGGGSTIKGRVTCPGQGTKDSCSVDVTAMIGSNVIAEDRSDSSGVYELKGLAPSGYTIRMNHAEDRFVAQQSTVTIASAGDTQTLDRTLDKRSFLTTYKVKYTKKAGVLKWSSRAYLAAVLPTERADNNDFQWYRNGAPIGGATGSSYRVTGADRGKKVKLCVRFGRFGFHTAAWACSSAKKV